MEVASRLVTIAEPTDVAHARRSAAELAAALGFDEQAMGRVAIAVTEAATNLLKHAGTGELVIGEARVGRDTGVQVVSLDRGPGIANVGASLRDGYSTAGTSGSGLGAIQRASDVFDLYTDGTGTVLAATIFARAVEAPQVGAVTAPTRGETRNGDAWAAWSAGELMSAFVCDGLGHGPEAASAAQLAVHAFQRHAERRAEHVITCVHEALRASRGAAVAVAELDHRTSTLRYCGVGNISAVTLWPNGTQQHLVSVSGIAGHVMRRLQEFSYPWPPGSMLVMHSDGIGTRWSLDRYPGLAQRRPEVIAGVLFRDHRRGRDDATVVVARQGTPS